MKCRQLASLVSSLLLGFFASTALSQEPAYMGAATHPGAGQFYTRVLASRLEYQESGTDVTVNAVTLQLSYGIQPALALLLENELANLSSDESDHTSVRLSTLQLKYRLFRRDLGPLNTWRTSILGGVAVPGNLDDSTPGRVYPQASLVSTTILGRHGLNGEVKWEQYGRDPYRIAVNGSHLYRLFPSEYAATTRGAWYTMVESLNAFTEKGDFRFDLALGILYEARRWAWELSLRLPVEQDWPQETNHTVTMGLRFLP